MDLGYTWGISGDLEKSGGLEGSAIWGSSLETQYCLVGRRVLGDDEGFGGGCDLGVILGS